jgi:multidrug efflux pump subunit AcrA (membrane-fusion protein)
VLRFRFGALLVALTVVCAGCSSGKPKAAPSPAPYVKTALVERGTIHPTLIVAGVVAPLRQVGVTADLTEPIADVYVQEGDRVHAGQPLARLVTDDLEASLASAERTTAENEQRYAQAAYTVNATNASDVSAIRSARAAVHQAQVSLAGALTDLKRYETLEAQGYLAPQSVDQQRTTVASDQASVNSAQATLNQAVASQQANGLGNTAGAQQSSLQSDRAAADASAATVEQLRRQLARAAIVSPVDGIVDAVNANPGEYPTERQLFTIEQISSVFAILPTSTTQIVQVPTGAKTSVEVTGASRKLSGKVAAVLDEVEPGTTNFTVKVLVPNSDSYLRAGMPVTGDIDLTPVSGLEVPVTAYVDDTRTTVYTVENGIIKTTNVREIQDDGKDAIVTGLSAGQRIVLDVGSATVGNGDKISLRPPPSPSPSPGDKASPAASDTP